MTTKPRLLVPVAAAVLGSSACAPDAAPREGTVATAAAPVLGGEIDADTRGVVAVVRHDPDGDAICTGTLVSPNLVLTARHCVARPPMIPGCSAQFGAPVSPAIVSVTTQTEVPWGSLEHHAQAIWLSDQNDYCGGDHALILLTEPVPESAATPIEPRVEQPAVAGETFSAVGYGYYDEETGEYGARRRADGLVVDCVGPEACEHPQMAETEWAAEGPCAGDSGGPALDSRGRVFGVVSRGSPGACGISKMGDVAAFGDWLVNAAGEAAAFGGFDTPGWAQPVSDEEPVEADEEPTEPAPPASSDTTDPTPAESGGCASSPAVPARGSSALLFAAAFAIAARRRSSRRA